jgi:hypothetical protein
VACRIEAFDPGLHDTKDFRCGSDSQDNFLRRTAKRQQRDGYTRLYVALALKQLRVGDGHVQDPEWDFPNHTADLALLVTS